jgi:BolA family transcriptional regulator, general stress-responsive regulator
VNVQQRIEQKLTETLQPSLLNVVNESPLHNVPPGSESHFRVLIVSQLFEHKSLVQRHRMVYAALGDEMHSVIHALAITPKTDAEWKTNDSAIGSPSCLGGSGH